MYTYAHSRTRTRTQTQIHKKEENTDEKMRLSNIYQINRYTDLGKPETNEKKEAKKTQPS